ncbi:hypothetical protein [Corynebacterium renale]|uniref:hypothetical protein n=1 Tax=Corynebacterium renale TaxID=1724 RepID=UPI000E011718|nr:hypothetical protein [Corynebacterium renale]STC97587.1 Uncharacterised protein [Corynebacterium renale]
MNTLQFSTGEELFAYVMENGPAPDPFIRESIYGAAEAGEYGVAVADYIASTPEACENKHLLDVIHDNFDLLPWEYPVDTLAELVGIW